MKNSRNIKSLKPISKNGLWKGVVALGLSLSVLSACNGQTQTNQAEQDNVTSDDVTQIEAGDPALGQLVTIRSGVVETLDDNGFVMESNNGDLILVINRTGTPFTQPEAAIPIQVTGQLDTFSAADSAEQYGIELEPELYDEYDQQPVIIADNFALAPRPQDLWNAPDEYYEEIIAVEGDLRPLEESANAFALFEEGWVSDTGVLIIGVGQLVDAADLEAGENIVVTGQARQLDENLLREAEFGWDDDQIQEFLSRYENRPVIIAEQIYPSAVPPHPSV
ncbi:hypothetical protein VB780_04540 [Leptolyngbya sp. CCNP1308]|uniref:hypothetical protein n=1 Tax=Leptolyngbya sp. CCNP1308 TaxID=3110255 RepID=UPI002B1EF8D0|nr:hypothetical protein [Leptolyngbya sp. CCNP1308]MEA5447825.1 hypothetical protein [Leptolyngbya sp. CCNP1308]